MSQTPDTGKFGGTVGVGIEQTNEKYQVKAPHSTNKPVITTDVKESLLGFQPHKLRPNVHQSQEDELRRNLIQQHSKVKSAKLNAEKATFEIIKPRVLGLICREINANLESNKNKADQSDGGDDDEQVSFASSEGSGQITFEDGSTELTVAYLEKVSTYEPDRQQELLDEFGLDSLTGFKLSKSFALEFGLPQSGLGPHIFLNDPTLDGVTRVIVNMIKSHAEKLVLDYESTFGTKFTDNLPNTSASPQSHTTATATTTTTTTHTHTTPTTAPKPQHQHAGLPKLYDPNPDYDTHDKTAAYVYRSTTDNRRIPYILGIGTAVPKIGAPQEHVIDAMLGPMRLDEKGAERFRKIGQHSGVDTRYSVLDNLGQIFWGKEGVNMDKDEYLDARQAVYKREAVKLSIQSSADAVRDWLGDKIYLNDQQRDTQREQVYKLCEELHRKYEQDALLKKQQPTDPTKIEKKLPQHLDPSLKSFAEGDQHVVPTTSGDAEEDKIIAQLGHRVFSTFNRTITHIVAITCTGIIVPGLEFHIMQALQLPLTTQRLPITFAGCFGAISGLRTASALAAENPSHRVLVVCTELCTLHMQLNDKIDNLIASALFADGSGSFIVGCAPTPKETPIFSIDTLSSFIIPNTVQQMAWEATKSGMVIGLAKEIASEIFNVIGDVVDDMLKYTPDPDHPQHRIHPSKCNMAIHPGGPLIINTIQSVFGLDHIDNSATKALSYSHPVAETWKILNEYGNMSSATLVFVLDRIREQPAKFNKPTPALAFGPGLNVECALLHRLEPKDKTHPKYQNANHQ